ncbi:IS1182 family transposase [Undibacterium arcticum]|uniref:IS1182 family transposase n=1 Tax=Undibacterium arcticum TaxID=1762892 RepID=A0ABV7FA63_9BURK
MARYKVVDRSPRFLPVILDAQLMPGSFEYALDYLIDHEIDLSGLDARYSNDATGAPAYNPAVMLKIVLLAYSRGMVSSRAIERACRENVLFMAISGDSAPQFTTVAKFVRELGPDIAALFTQVLMTCDAQGLIGRHMFAIDGVKLPSNASKHRSGTHAELAHDADRMERAVTAMLEAHQSRDAQSDQGGIDEDDGLDRQRIERLHGEAQRIRNFLLTHTERKSDKGAVRKSNVTDNDSAKMATAKCVIQGYTAVAAVDSQHQVIVAAQAHGSGSEQSTLLPMIRSTDALRTDQTLITADAGYHSEANLRELHDAQIPALIADGLMRRRDERFREQGKYKTLPDPLADKSKTTAELTDTTSAKRFTPKDFIHDAMANTCICPAGKQLYSNGKRCTTNGRMHHKFAGAQRDCVPCPLRQRCLRHPERTLVRQVAFFKKNQASPLQFTERMKQAIDSPQGRALYGQRRATVEPVFGNLRYNKRLDRFTLRGQSKVNTQWHLYCLVHNIEKLAHHGYGT